MVTVWLKKDSHKSETAGGGSSLDKIADNFCQLFWVHFSAFDLIQLCLEGASDTQLSQPAHKQTTLQWLIQGKGKQVSGGASPLSWRNSAHFNYESRSQSHQPDRPAHTYCLGLPRNQGVASGAALRSPFLW